MSVLAEFAKLMDSRLYKLMLDGRAIGMRAKIYDMENRKFDYYDFPTNIIKNKTLRGFLITETGTFEKLQLFLENGQYVTEDELKSGICIQEFKDEETAERILFLFMDMYNSRERYGG